MMPAHNSEGNSMLGLIGLGLVGTALAKRFTGAGFDVIGYDVVDEQRESARKLGVLPANSPAEVFRSARRVVLSLPTSREVEAVTSDATEELRPGDVIIDTTTGDPVDSARLAERLAKRGVTFIDATILGSSQQVADHDVVVMAGGSAQAIATCGDVFDSFARRTFAMGESGSGAIAKLVANLVLGLHRLVLAEGLALGESAGVDPEAMLDVLRAGSTFSRVMDVKGDKMIQRDYAPQGRLAQHLKDVELIIELAQRAGARIPLTDLHRDLLDAAVGAGLGEQDNSAVIELFRPSDGGTRGI